MVPSSDKQSQIKPEQVIELYSLDARVKTES